MYIIIYNIYTVHTCTLHVLFICCHSGSCTYIIMYNIYTVHTLHVLFICCHSGSCQCRVGWANEAKPRMVFRNAVARTRGKKVCICTFMYMQGIVGRA